MQGAHTPTQSPARRHPNYTWAGAAAGTPTLLIHNLPNLATPPLKPVVPEFECLGVFADDAFFGFGESFGFGGVDVHGDFEVGTTAG